MFELTLTDGTVIYVATSAEAAQAKAADLKMACNRAITDTGLSWMVERQVSAGVAIPSEVVAACESYRAHSGALEDQVAAVLADTTISEAEKVAALNAIVWAP